MTDGDIRWSLVSESGFEFPLPQTMIFLGREECDVTLQSRSVDKRHAVVTYDHYEKRFKVKDLNSVNGTYVNDTRIPEQSYVKLEHKDTLRFGYDPRVYSIHSSVSSASGVDAISACQPLCASVATATTPSSTASNWPPPSGLQDNNHHHHHHHRDHATSPCQGCLHEQAIQHTCGGVQQQIPPGPAGCAPSSFAPPQFPAPSPLIPGPMTDCCGNLVLDGAGPAAYPAGPVYTASHAHAYANAHSQHHPLAALHPANPIGQYHHPTVQRQQLEHHPSEQAQPGGSSRESDGTTSSSDRARATPTTPAFSQPVAGVVAKCRFTESSSSNASIKSALSSDSLDQLSEKNWPQERRNGRAASTEEEEAGKSSKKKSVNADSKQPQPEINNRNNAKQQLPAATVTANQNNDTHRLPATTTQSPPPVEIVELEQPPKRLVTAFTVDFDDTKKFDIKDSISKFAPPKPESERPPPGHRRNHSLGKAEDCKGKEEKQRGAYDLSPEQSSEKGFYAARKVAGLRRGYHSEGYFSSDQDDERGDLLPKHKSRTPDKDTKKSPGFVQQLMSLAERHHSKGGDSSGLNSSAAFLIDKMFSTTAKDPPPSPNKRMMAVNGTRKAATPRSEKVPSSRRISSPPQAATAAAAVEPVIRPSVLNVNSQFVVAKSTTSNITVAITTKTSTTSGVNVSDDDAAKDNVSETGTYTIDKDSPNSELDEARRNIDKVFGIKPEERVAEEVEEAEEAVITGPRGMMTLDLREASPESGSNSKSGSNRGTPTWLREWASSVPGSRNSISPDRSQQQSPTVLGQKGMREVAMQGQAPPPSPTTANNSAASGRPLPVEGPQRPRRKLPTPPVDKPPFSIASRTNELSDLDVSVRDRTSSTSVSVKTSSRSVIAQSPTDSNYDTEKLLRDTENVVTAMEARMDQRRTFPTPMGSSLESKDSGGESDVDTSTASYCNDAKLHSTHAGRHLNAKIKAKLKLLEESGKRTPPKAGQKVVASASMSSAARLHVSRTRSMTLEQQENSAVVSDNASECETVSIASDVSSSSDISGSSPRTRRKSSDKNLPTLKFNRAFSLRRARLGYTSDGTTSSDKLKATPTPASSQPVVVPKGKSSETSSRRVKPSSSLSSTSTNLSRNDGGRFSLRVNKNAAKSSGSTSTTRADTDRAKSKASGTSSSASRSHSTMSSKEAEMKNWRRRKEYDPMKAAAEGRKKEAVAKKGGSQQRPNRTPTPPDNNNGGMVNNSSSSSFQRSASFHGTEGLHRLRRTTYTSEDDVARSLEDEAMTVSATNLSLQLESDFVNENTEVYVDQYRGHRHDSYRTASDEFSVDDVRPSSTGRMAAQTNSSRPKKYEALDNLVITTIHQLSWKLCSQTQLVLKRLRDQCPGNDETSHTLEDLMDFFRLPETPTSPNTRTMSRDLAGTLRNMKKLEKGLQVIERVLACDADIPTDCTIQECSVINGRAASSRSKCNGLPDGEYY